MCSNEKFILRTLVELRLLPVEALSTRFPLVELLEPTRALVNKAEYIVHCRTHGFGTDRHT